MGLQRVGQEWMTEWVNEEWMTELNWMSMHAHFLQKEWTFLSGIVLVSINSQFLSSDDLTWSSRYSKICWNFILRKRPPKFFIIQFSDLAIIRLVTNWNRGKGMRIEGFKEPCMMLVGGHKVAEEKEIVEHFWDVCFVRLLHHLFSLR